MDTEGTAAAVCLQPLRRHPVHAKDYFSSAYTGFHLRHHDFAALFNGRCFSLAVLILAVMGPLQNTGQYVSVPVWSNNRVGGFGVLCGQR